MSHLIPPAVADRPAPRHGKPVSGPARLRGRLLRTAVLPSAVVLAPAAAMPWLIPGTSGAVAVAVPAAVVASLAVSWRGALAAVKVLGRQEAEADERARQALGQVRHRADVLGQELFETGRQARQGLPPVAPGDLPPAPPGESPADHAQYSLTVLHHAARVAMSDASNRTQTEILTNLARRLQGLIDRVVRALDEVENEVEDPDLLDQLYQLDHLATRIRRQADNIAVVGGAVPRRINEPMTLANVLRQAVQEIDHYARVSIVPPVPGTLKSYFAADVIHMFAELMENATRFSPRHTTVRVTAQTVSAGVAVEIEDRGLTMQEDVRLRLNGMLADPERARIDVQLRDGRIGTLVVALLAARQKKNIRVELRPNIYNGTTAVAVLPHALLEPAPPVPDTAQGRTGAVTAVASATTAQARRHPHATLPPPSARPDIRARPHAAPATGPRTPARSTAPAPQGMPPALPRRSGSHLAPGLRDTPASTAPAAAQSPGTPTPTLAAQFLHGRDRAADSPAPTPKAPKEHN
ncbi:ATP-binding protein [Streptomyces sp. NPDC058391]|uniref:sensor histidine kinase n=1 Tax=Streptomyces sp. NPDC058391 TaxID=3346476 RepID=UPI0036472922